MGRQPRPLAEGLVYHALNRGNNRSPVFGAPEDYRAFLKALAQTQQRYPFRLYGYCLMTNHFHLLPGPRPGQKISRILQSLTVAHTWRYHRTHGTVGHVWQGRFRSPVFQSDAHALTVLRYAEANPLRAGMVSDLRDYPWSSYPAHGEGRPDLLLSELPSWADVACWSGAASGRLGRAVPRDQLPRGTGQRPRAFADEEGRAPAQRSNRIRFNSRLTPSTAPPM
jgi:putative transposase